MGPTSRLIPRFLVTPSIRLYHLRAVTVLSAMIIWYAAWLYTLANRPGVVISAVVITSITCIHHIGTALGPTFFPIPNIADLVLSACETIWAIYMMARLIHWKTTFNLSVKWFPKRAVFGLCAFCGLTLALIGLLILKCCNLACSNEDIAHVILERSDVLRDNTRPPKTPLASHRRWTYGVRALFGRRPWQEKIPGESQWIRISRGLATVVIVIVLAVFGAYEIILKPIAEMGMVPSRALRSFVITDAFQPTQSIVYNLAVAWRQQPDASKSLLEAATVDIIPRLEGPVLNACTKSSYDHLYELPPDYAVVVFQCARPVPDFKGSKYGLDEFLENRDFRRPNLHLRVDFDGLRASNSFPDTIDLISDALQIWLGLTEDIVDVTNTTSPLPLLPGSNLLTISEFSVRQKLKPRSLATLGFDLYSTFIMSRFSYTIPNPYVNTTTPTVSTLRIVPSLDVGDWVIDQEFRKQSVLNGMSTLGGLGTFLSSLLVIMLGSTLMQAVRGKNPYSPFGFLHNTDKEQRRLRENCFDKYPRMRREVMELSEGEARDTRGILHFLLDTLIDVESLGFRAHSGSSRGSLDRGLEDTEMRVTKPATAEDRYPYDIESGIGEVSRKHELAVVDR